MVPWKSHIHQNPLKTYSTKPKKPFIFVSADDTDDGIGLCGWILTAISWAMVLATLPFSLCVCFKVSSKIRDETQRLLKKSLLLLKRIKFSINSS